MTLRIVCCRIPGTVRPETAAALSAHTPTHVSIGLIDLDPNDDQAYGAALAKEWFAAYIAYRPLAIVEPDIVVRRDVIDAFLTHQDEYVAFPYALKTHVGPALGCTRFSARFIERHPHLMAEAVATGVGWRQLDVVIMRRLLAKKYGEQPTVLLPPVEHLNEAKALLPEADPTPVMRVPDIEEIGNLA